MAVPKNIDRYNLDESYDATPIKVQSIFNSANNGYTRRQSRLANELTEKDAAIAQAWSVRVAAIASCPWEIVGGTAENNDFIEKSLKGIQPSFDSGLVSFNKLLQFLQSAVMLGFSANTIEWGDGDDNITGFKLFDQSLFSFQESELPYFTGKGIGIDVEWRSPVLLANSDSIDADLAIIKTDTGTDIPNQITALNDISSADVKTQADQSLVDYGADTLSNVKPSISV